jgi:hypothetical protein
MTQETPERPPIRRTVRNILLDFHRVTDDLLVSIVHDETGAGTLAIRATVKRMELQGEIYNATGDADAPEWKVTSP